MGRVNPASLIIDRAKQVMDSVDQAMNNRMPTDYQEMQRARGVTPKITIDPHREVLKPKPPVQTVIPVGPRKGKK